MLKRFGFNERMGALLVLIIIAILSIGCARKTSAQQAPPSVATYQIVQNDNLWRILDAKCGVGAGSNWRQYLAMPENANLSGNFRAFTVPTGPNKGMPGWTVYQGEKLTLPTANCNLPTAALVPIAPAATTPAGPTLGQIDQLLTQKLGLVGTHIPWWLWILLALLFAAAIAALVYALTQRERSEQERLFRARENELHEAANEAHGGQIAALENLNEQLAELLTDAREREHVRNLEGGLVGFGRFGIYGRQLPSILGDGNVVIVGNGNGYPPMPRTVVVIDEREPEQTAAPQEPAPAAEPAHAGN